MSLTLTEVGLSYPDGDAGRIDAVADLNLHVDAGQVVALTGPSGCGKSSVLAVAGTLIRPDRGSVVIGGERVDDLDDADRSRVRRDRIGFVFQNDNLLPELTALEQVLLAAHLRGQRPEKHRGQARDLLAAVGLADHEGKLPKQMSGGMRQRVNIARALMGSPQVLLIDEPTSALDQARGHAIIELIVSLSRDADVAALLVTHDLASLTDNGVADVVHMLDGRIAAPAVL